MTAIGFRLALGELRPEELDLAFSYAVKHHASGFRPTPGEICNYLKAARESIPPQVVKRLPEPDLSEEEREAVKKEIIEGLKKVASL